LQNHGVATDLVVRGQRAAANLSGAHPSEIVRGHELATTDYLTPSKVLTVDLEVLADSPWPIKHRSRQRLYIGTQEVMVTVALLHETVIKPGQRGLAQLHCAKPVVATGRQPFVVRAESPLVTIGGGRVLLPCLFRVTKRQSARLERLHELRQAGEAERAEIGIFMYGLQSVSELDLCRDAAIDVNRARQLIEGFVGSGIVVKVAIKPRSTLYVHHEVLKEANDRICCILSELHTQWPLRPSIPRDRVVAKCQAWHEAQVTNALLDGLIGCGTLQSKCGGVALAPFAPQLTPAQVRLREQLLAAWHEAALKPPEPSELCKILASNESEFQQIIDLCAAQGDLVHLSGDIFLHREVENSMRSQIQRRMANGTGLTVSEIKELLATSRKFAVPICEYLDRIGFTRREGDLRMLRESSR
jgi:selenocysteine-specific elongation factor